MSTTPPTTTPATMTAPDTQPPEPEVGTRAIPAFWVLLAPELTAPLAASLCEALAATLELAAALEVAVVLMLPDALTEDTEDVEDVALLPPIPGLSSKETSLARSPHRASRAGGQLYRFVERNTNLRRRVEYRSNRSSYLSVTLQSMGNTDSLIETMPDVGSKLFSRAKTLGLVPSLSGPCIEMTNVPSTRTPCTSSLFETSLLTFVPFYTVCKYASV